MLRCLIVLMVSFFIAVQASEDRRAIAHGDGNGYDFFDFSWSFLGHSRVNTKGSYDFFDRQGHLVGWAQATTGSRVDFFFANGEPFRTVITDATGGVMNLDAYGNVKTIGVTNTRGGADFYNPFTMQVANSSTSLDYIEFGEKPPGEE